MRIFDPQKAITNKTALKEAILGHADNVRNGTAQLDQLDLEEYGIRLEDNDWHSCRKWTKKSDLVYREEVVLLSGLWRSISVRLTTKQHYHYQ